MAKRTRTPTQESARAAAAAPPDYPNPRTPAFREWIEEKLAVRDPSTANIVSGWSWWRAQLVELPTILDALEDILRTLRFQEGGYALALVRAWRLPDPPLSTVYSNGLNELAPQLEDLAEYYDLGDVADNLWHAFTAVGMAISTTPVHEMSYWKHLKGPRKGAAATKAKKQTENDRWRKEARRLWATDPDRPVTEVADLVIRHLALGRSISRVSHVIATVRPQSWRPPRTSVKTKAHS